MMLAACLPPSLMGSQELTHGFENQINVLVILSPDDIQELNDVRMPSKFLQDIRPTQPWPMLPSFRAGDRGHNYTGVLLLFLGQAQVGLGGREITH